MDIQGLFPSLRSLLVKILSLFNDFTINYEARLLAFVIKINNLHFAQKNTFPVDLVDATVFLAVVHGCLYSEVHGFFGHVGRFSDFHFHQWSMDGHGENGTGHRWITGGPLIVDRWECPGPPMATSGITWSLNTGFPEASFILSEALYEIFGPVKALADRKFFVCLNSVNYFPTFKRQKMNHFVDVVV